jgi:hypothetical protein
MDVTLMGPKVVYALVYLDDILIFSNTMQEHARRVKMVLDRIREAKFKLNLDKCTFAAREVAYLGHLVSARGVSPDASKVKAIKFFPLPRNVRDIRAFLGLAGYYRSFIPNFAALSKPLTQLTRKDVKFSWSEPQQASFDALKEALTSDSILAHPEFDKPFIRSCDASNYAISAILSQDHEGKERPLSFASRTLNNHEINYSTTEKELLAVLFGVQTHKCFLYGRRFEVITDHVALRWPITVKNHQCARLTRWVLKLAEYDFEILHRPGKKHTNADVLSRHVATAVRKQTELGDAVGAEIQLQAEMTISKEVISQAQVRDEYCTRINQALSEGKIVPYFCDQESVLYHKSSSALEEPKIVVPLTLREQIIWQHHKPVFLGHQGEKRTLSNLRLYYYWPSMSKDVEKFIQKCTSCAKLKGGRTPLAPLGELPETTGPMEITSIYMWTLSDHSERKPLSTYFYLSFFSVPGSGANTKSRSGDHCQGACHTSVYSAWLSTGSLV